MNYCYLYTYVLMYFCLKRFEILLALRFIRMAHSRKNRESVAISLLKTYCSPLPQKGKE